jgi:hypothetical protein
MLDSPLSVQNVLRVTNHSLITLLLSVPYGLD